MENTLITKDGMSLWTQEQLQNAMIEALYKQRLLTDEQRRSIREGLHCNMLDNTKED